MNRERLCSPSCRRGAIRSSYSFDQCRSCWRLINEPKIVQALIPANLPCIHRGEQLSERASCSSCRGKVELKLYECDVYGKCTLAKKLDGVGCCKDCPSFQSPISTETKNLLYYLFPISGNGIWQRNLDQLLSRINIFNGKKIVAVSRKSFNTTQTLDHPDCVREYLSGYDVEVLELDNSPKLREVSSWVLLWNQLVNQPGITLWAHAKGVTRPVNRGTSIHSWSDILYHTSLDYMRLVEQQLSQYPITGSFKKVGKGFKGSKSAFHYSGGFYWLRNFDFFSRSWFNIDKVWWGTESFPGVHYSVEEAGCLFLEGKVPSLDLYNLKYLNNFVIPELDKWKIKHKSFLNHSSTG